MKPLVFLFLSFLSISAWSAPPILRNAFTTNSNPGSVLSLTNNIQADDVLFFTTANGSNTVKVAKKTLISYISILDYPANGSSGAPVDPSGVLDSSGGIRAAITNASTTGKAVYIPAGTYKVGSTITIPSGAGYRLFGDGYDSLLYSTILDGSPVIDCATGTSYVLLNDFRVDSLIDGTQFLAGTIGGQNCIGIRLNGTTSVAYSTRNSVNNVFVRGCKVGWFIHSFIGSFENFWSTYNEVGLVGIEMHSTRINPRFEGNRKDFTLDTSWGVHFDQTLCEGGVLASNLVSSTVESSYGITFTSPYFEQVRNVPFITFGATNACRSISFNNGNFQLISTSATTNVDNNIYPLVFDRVNGLNVTGNFSTGEHDNRYSVTTNTTDIVDNSFGVNSVAGITAQDLSLSMLPRQNLFPNSNFDLWLRGWPDLTFTGLVGSRETNIVRKGVNALRLTMTAGQTVATANFIFSDSYLGVLLRGKMATYYAWVWVPNTADFNPSDSTNQLCSINLQFSYNGTGGTTVYSSSLIPVTQRGTWNLLVLQTSILPIDMTSITCSIRMAKPSIASGAESIVVSPIYLYEGVGGYNKVLNGHIQDSGMNPVSIIGGKLVQRIQSTLPTSTNMSYELGDQFILTSPTVGGVIGSVVTTAGTGASMVTKTFGLIDQASTNAVLTTDTVTITPTGGLPAYKAALSTLATLLTAGSATNLTPWPSDINGAGFSLTNFYGFARQLTSVITNTGPNVTPGLVLSNLTPGTAGIQIEDSPALLWTGNQWLTGSLSNAADSFRIYVLPITSASAGNSQLNLEASLNGGAYSQIANFSSGGNFTSQGSIAAATTGFITFGSRSRFASSVDGALETLNNATTARASLQANIPQLTKTANYQAVTLDSGIYFNNVGAVAAQTNWLPAAVSGMQFSSDVDAAQIVSIHPFTNTVDVIRWGSTLGTTNSDIWSSQVGSRIHLTCVKAGLWVVDRDEGAWTFVAPRKGNSILVSGTNAVANTTVTSNTAVFLSRKTAGGTMGTGGLTYTTTAGTGFTIFSVDTSGATTATDTSTVSWKLEEVPN